MCIYRNGAEGNAILLATQRNASLPHQRRGPRPPLSPPPLPTNKRRLALSPRTPQSTLRDITPLVGAKMSPTRPQPLTQPKQTCRRRKKATTYQNQTHQSTTSTNEWIAQVRSRLKMDRAAEQPSTKSCNRAAEETHSSSHDRDSRQQAKKRSLATAGRGLTLLPNLHCTTVL